MNITESRPGPGSIITPCVGICSTGIGGNVCRGCKRYAHEVIRWNSYSQQERQIIWRRLEMFRVTIMKRWVEVIDEEQLRRELQRQKIKVNPGLNSLAWAYDLLRVRAEHLKSLEPYGLKLLPEVSLSTIEEIFQEIEKEYLTLSEAHYARYFSDAPGS
jgi:predicted Fe-S protein YdhL (DUF1289 family)